MNIEPELISLRSKLSVEIERDTKEIEFLKKRVSKNEALLHAVKGSLSVAIRDGSKSATAKGYGAKSDSVRAAINRLPNSRFTIEDVEREIFNENPKSDLKRAKLRTALWTLADKDEIKLLKKGTNTEPAEYEKINGLVLALKRAVPPSDGAHQDEIDLT